MTATQTLLTGLRIGESPRWHDGRLWLSNWLGQEIIAVDPAGHRETMVRLPFEEFPFSIDWLPDGRLLIVSASDRPLLSREADGTLATYAASDRGWNEVVVDGATLIVADSYGHELTAFDIAANGGLENRRVWADLGDGVPDGICLDSDGAAWYADVPNKRCVRVREGGEVLQTVELDRGGFACMLGGADGRTLFILCAEWRGVAGMADSEPTGQVVTIEAPAPHAGRP